MKKRMAVTVFNGKAIPKEIRTVYKEKIATLEKELLEQKDLLREVQLSFEDTLKSYVEKEEIVDEKYASLFRFQTSINLYSHFLDSRMQIANQSLSEPIEDSAQFLKNVIDLENSVERLNQISNMSSIRELEGLVAEEEAELYQIESENCTRKSDIETRKARVSLQIHPISPIIKSFPMLEFPPQKDIIQNQEQYVDLMNQRTQNLSQKQSAYLNDIVDLNEAEENAYNIQKSSLKRWQTKRDKILRYNQTFKNIDEMRVKIIKLQDENTILQRQLSDLLIESYQARRIHSIENIYRTQIEDEMREIEIRKASLNEAKNPAVRNQINQQASTTKINYAIQKLENEIAEKEMAIDAIEKNADMVQLKLNSALKEIQYLELENNDEIWLDTGINSAARFEETIQLFNEIFMDLE